MLVRSTLRCLPLAGVKRNRTFVCSLPAWRCLSVSVSVWRADAPFDALVRPFPFAESLPACGTDTFSVSVWLLTARCTTRSAYGQPVTSIDVLCLSVAPFWAVKTVGMVRLVSQRFLFAARADNGPSGRFSSKLPTGTSGTVLKGEDIIPVLLMNVSLWR